MKLRTIYNLFLLIPFMGCKTAGIITPRLAELQTKEVVKVSLQDLLKNKASYQGRLIETEGIYKSGFEESAVYYRVMLPLGDTIIKGQLITSTANYNTRQHLALWDGLWISNHPRYKIKTSELKDNLVKVRGYFDTTGKGHLGSFAAELANVYLMQQVE